MHTVPSESFVLILLGGELTNNQLAMELAVAASNIVCADSGAEHARRLGMDVDAIVGDLDSISKETLTHYREHGVEIVRHTDQEHNDFEKVLRYLTHSAEQHVIVLGMTGGRVDHTLSNLSVMLRYADRFKSLVAYDALSRHQFLTAERMAVSFDCPIGTTISLSPYGIAEGVTTHNLMYPLNMETLSLGVREGLSNVSTGTPVTISIVSGALLVTMNSVSSTGA